MTDPTPFLEIKGLSKIYNRGTPQEVIALGDLNLEVHKGDFVSIIGSNGSGKTTLLNVISGAVRPTRGNILLDSSDVTNRPVYKRAGQISRVYQDPSAGTSPSMSVEQNLVLASLRGKRAGFGFGVTAGRREVIENLLSELGMGLETRLRDRVSNLSGGQRQALAMVMSTMVRPQLLLLDEHCAALDPRMSRLIMEMTERLVKTYELTTLMVSHDMELAINHGNRLVMLHQGRIIEDIKREEKKLLKEEDLLEQFRKLKHEEEQAGLDPLNEEKGRNAIRSV